MKTKGKSSCEGSKSGKPQSRKPLGVSQAAVARSAAVKAEGDPMKLTGRQSAKRRHSNKIAKMMRGSPLANLRARGRLSHKAFSAGMHIHNLFIEGLGGVAALDFSRERVDGGQIGRAHV